MKLQLRQGQGRQILFVKQLREKKKTRRSPSSATFVWMDAGGGCFACCTKGNQGVRSVNLKHLLFSLLHPQNNSDTHMWRNITGRNTKAFFLMSFFFWCWSPSGTRTLDHNVSMSQWKPTIISQIWRTVSFVYRAEKECVAVMGFYELHLSDTGYLLAGCCHAADTQIFFLLCFPVFLRDSLYGIVSSRWHHTCP